MALKKLVGELNNSWPDMSPYVVHFTSEHKGHDAEANNIAMLAALKIEARSRFGTGRGYRACPKSVCFSEIPLHNLARLADKRGKYGIGFRKELIVSRDGGPIMYAYKNTSHAKAILELAYKAKDDPDSPIWKIAPFVDQPGDYGSKKYFFEWEREWRHVGDFAFRVHDVAFLIIPKADHSIAREYFQQMENDGFGPNYACPYIDPYWSKDQVKAAFK